MGLLQHVGLLCLCTLTVKGQIQFGGGLGQAGVAPVQVQPQVTNQAVAAAAAVSNVQQGATIFFDESPVEANPSCVTPDQRQGLCKPLAQCAVFYAEIPSLLDNPCTIRANQQGICCPLQSEKPKQRPPGRGSDGVLSPPPPPNVPIPKINQQQLQQAADSSIRTFQEKDKVATSILFEDNQIVQKDTPAAAHQRFFQTTNEVLKRGKDAALNVEATATLARNFNLSPLQGTFALPRFSARGTAIGNTCPQVSQCRPDYPYRTVDGSCNNKQNPDWGKAGTQFQRILPPRYGDGFNSPRVRADGQPLPSPRLISAVAIPDENRPYSNLTLMLMQWGQFLDHDMTHTPISRGPNGTGIACCSQGVPIPADRRNPDCIPIDIPRNDPFFSTFGQQCMEMVRSLPAQRRECNFGPREQMNQITAWLDGSNVYGSSDARAKSLREFVNGRLAVQNTRSTRGRDMLPANPGECSDPQRQRFCFRAGDTRVNEQVELAVVHTIWVREHNRVAAALQQLNPNWPDEVLFQEARRIVVAEMQHITYNEFLPLVLGPEFMHSFELTPKTAGHTTLYNPEIDPTITNEFAAAAYRFGHTLVQGVIKEFNQFGAVSNSMPFAKTQFQPFSLYESFDSYLRGLQTQECQQFDNFVTDALTNHLFEGTSNFGLDLMALNIQRGRDHGLPPFNDFREVCGFQRARSWPEMASFMRSGVVENLQRIYSSPDEVDLFVGGIGEMPLPGAILGPTFVCLVGDQFARLRRGDRFHYEERTARFTEAQLNQIRKVSLARVICDNSDEITVTQPLVFQVASFLNKREPCNSPTIPGIDFSFWRQSRRGRQGQGQPQGGGPPPGNGGGPRPGSPGGFGPPPGRGGPNGRPFRG